MADEDEPGFLRRWSRRKVAATRPPPPPPEPEPPPPDLPPIESLGAASDYSVFLQRGVAAEVQRQALQRAWSTDAKIASFRGMAEYDWDFNAVGYGRLWAVDDVAKLVAEVLTTPEPDPPAPEPIASAPAEPEALDAEPPPESEPEPEAPPQPPIRRHGSALPA